MLTTKILRKHARQRAARYWAARAVRRHGVIAACRAMQTLNFYGKEESTAWQPAIYAAKNLLIHHLYRVYGAIVTEQRPFRRCWGVHDPKLDEFVGCQGEGCLKCGGRGLVSGGVLYLYHFTVANERFFWHQPASAVAEKLKPDVTMLTEEHERPRAEGGPYTSPSKWQAELLYATVCEYLQRVGEPVPIRDTIGLWDAIMADVGRVRIRIADHMQHAHARKREGEVQ